MCVCVFVCNEEVFSRGPEGGKRWVHGTSFTKLALKSFQWKQNILAQKQIHNGALSEHAEIDLRLWGLYIKTKVEFQFILKNMMHFNVMDNARFLRYTKIHFKWIKDLNDIYKQIHKITELYFCIYLYNVLYGANFSKLGNSAFIRKKIDVFSYTQIKKMSNLNDKRPPKQSENTYNRLEKILLHKWLIVFINKCIETYKWIWIRQKTQNWSC